MVAHGWETRYGGGAGQDGAGQEGRECLVVRQDEREGGRYAPTVVDARCNTTVNCLFLMYT